MFIEVITLGIYEAQADAVLTGFQQVEAEGPVYRKEILAVIQRSAEQSRLRTRRIKYLGVGWQGKQ